MAKLVHSASPANREPFNPRRPFIALVDGLRISGRIYQKGQLIKRFALQYSHKRRKWLTGKIGYAENYLELLRETAQRLDTADEVKKLIGEENESECIAEESADTAESGTPETCSDGADASCDNSGSVVCSNKSDDITEDTDAITSDLSSDPVILSDHEDLPAETTETEVSAKVEEPKTEVKSDSINKELPDAIKSATFTTQKVSKPKTVRVGKK